MSAEIYILPPRNHKRLTLAYIWIDAHDLAVPSNYLNLHGLDTDMAWRLIFWLLKIGLKMSHLTLLIIYYFVNQTIITNHAITTSCSIFWLQFPLQNSQDLASCIENPSEQDLEWYLKMIQFVHWSLVHGATLPQAFMMFTTGSFWLTLIPLFYSPSTPPPPTFRAADIQEL